MVESREGVIVLESGIQLKRWARQLRQRRQRCWDGESSGGKASVCTQCSGKLIILLTREPTIKILSHAREVGSPTNHPGSGQWQNTGPGILWFVHRWTNSLSNSYLQKILKRTDRTFDPFLLRQGEPGTSQYTMYPWSLQENLFMGASAIVALNSVHDYVGCCATQLGHCTMHLEYCTTHPVPCTIPMCYCAAHLGHCATPLIKTLHNTLRTLCNTSVTLGIT